MPGAESEFAVIDEYDLARSGEDGLHVGIGVALGVLVRAFVGNEAIEDSFDVAGDVGIGVLVDGDSGGGVRNIDVADAAFHIGFPDSLFDFAGYIHKLRAAIGFDAKSLHCFGSLWNRNDEVGADVFDAGVAFDFFEALLAPAGGEGEKTQFAGLQRFVRIQEVRQELLVRGEHVLLVV